MEKKKENAYSILITKYFSLIPQHIPHLIRQYDECYSAVPKQR